jgi:hypothetical protein
MTTGRRNDDGHAAGDPDGAAGGRRWAPYGVRTNAEVSGPLLRQRFRLAHDAMEPLRRALDRGLMSVSGVDRTMRVAWATASTVKLYPASVLQTEPRGRTDTVRMSDARNRLLKTAQSGGETCYRRRKTARLAGRMSSPPSGMCWLKGVRRW